MIDRSFIYNDISSVDMGVSIVRVDSGMPSRPYTSSKSILETHPNKSLYPYFLGVKHEPMTFSVTIASENSDMNDTKMYDLANWLFQNEYKPFISYDNPSKTYYAMAINRSDFITNGFNEGYFTIEFRCRDGFGWITPTVETYDLSTITVPTTIQITNSTNVLDYYYPEVEITMEDTNTDVSLVNNSDGGRTFTFTSLNVGETVYVDNQKRIIISDLVAATNRFSNFNNGWMRLIRGVNNIEVTGKCTIKVRLHVPVYN